VDDVKESYMAISDTSRKQVLIMGDINLSNVAWVTNDSDAAGMEFEDLIMYNYLVQHVESPTRKNNILVWCQYQKVAWWIRQILWSIWEIVIII
jgi:hypothetical protein